MKQHMLSRKYFLGPHFFCVVLGSHHFGPHIIWSKNCNFKSMSFILKKPVNSLHSSAESNMK